MSGEIQDDDAVQIPQRTLVLIPRYMCGEGTTVLKVVWVCIPSSAHLRAGCTSRADWARCKRPGMRQGAYLGSSIQVDCMEDTELVQMMVQATVVEGRNLRRTTVGTYMV